MTVSGALPGWMLVNVTVFSNNNPVDASPVVKFLDIIAWRIEDTDTAYPICIERRASTDEWAIVTPRGSVIVPDDKHYTNLDTYVMARVAEAKAMFAQLNQQRTGGKP